MENHSHYHHNIPLFVAPPSPVFSSTTTTNNNNSNWAYLCRGKSGEDGEEELKQALLYATLELESTKAAAHDELNRMEVETSHLKALLDATTRERDEARKQCHQALLLLHGGHQHNSPSADYQLPPQPFPPEDNGGASASSEESSIVSSPHPQQPPVHKAKELAELEVGTSILAAKKELPERGKLLEAVIKAGPLLQNLLLAGPLPQWRHPPPPLRSFEIPPVSIAAVANAPAAKEMKREEGGKKRKEMDGGDMVGAAAAALSSSPCSSSWSLSPNSSGNAKYQRSAAGLEAMEYYY